jgi:hypothetical protein
MRLAQGAGETVEEFISHTTSTELFDPKSSVTTSEQIRPRFSTNDILLASDHRLHSIVKISRGEGYAQFGGLQFVAESAYHISKPEYERRKAMAWPAPTAETFIPREHRSQVEAAPPPRTSGPILATEVIGEFKLSGDQPAPRKPRRNRPEGGPT